MAHDILLKEFILDIDEDWGVRVSRQSYVARLTRDPDPLHDVNEWQTRFSGGAVAHSQSSRERPARDRFAQEVLRLRAMARKAQEADLYANSRFTVGSWASDAE